MADIEKVIKGLESCANNGYCAENYCPYENEAELYCIDVLLRDALELLKSQPQVIRCKDCKYYIEPTEEEAGGCLIKAGYFPVSENWFCADGGHK